MIDLVFYVLLFILLADLLCMHQCSAGACNIMFTVHCVSVQWIVISLAPQSLSLRNVKAQFSAAVQNSKVLCLLNS